MRGPVEYDIFDIPVDGHFRGMGRPPGFDFPGHHGPGFGPGPFWGHGFDHSSERFRHGPGGPRCGRRGSPNKGCGHSPVRPEHHTSGPRGGFGCDRGSPHRGCDGHSPVTHGDHGPHHGAEGRRCGSPNRGCNDHSPARHEGNHGTEHHRRGPPEHGHRGPGGRHGSPHYGCKDHSPARNGPDHPCGPPEHGHRFPHCGRSKSPGRHCGRPSEPHCFGPPGRRHGPGPHGPWFRHSPESHRFGRHGPFDFPWGGPWKGPWGFDHHRPGFGRHGPGRPGFGPRPCPYNIPERPSRNADCEKCRENEPCCSKNKGQCGRDGGRKEKGPCSQRNKEQNPTGDTVFVQRIVLESAPRPQSV